MPLPAKSTIANFDGQNKVNGIVPPSVQSTDWNNPSLGACTSDVAGLGQTACTFWCRLELASTTGGLLVRVWSAVWANVTPIAPIPTRTSTGLFVITLPTLVSDEYDASVGLTNNIAVNLQAASCNIENTTGTFGFFNAKASGNLITIACADTTGTPSDFVTHTAFIKAYS